MTVTVTLATGLLLSLLSGASASGTVSIFAAVADTYVVQNRASINFGTATKLRVQDSPAQRTYLRFDVQGASTTITKATLRLWSTAGATIGFDARGVPDTTWGETTITYANAPPPATTVTGSSGAISAGEWIQVDVTPLVRSNGLVSLALTTTDTTTITFASRDAGTATAPQLVVTSTSDVLPASTVPPAISGEAREGQTLAATTGDWSGTSPTYAYQWRRCNGAGTACTDIAGATASTYTLVSADVGSTVGVFVTASNDAGSASASSATTGVVAGNPPGNLAAPVLGGQARDGETLTASAGSWSGTTPLSYAYQWERSGNGGSTWATISAATNASYTVQAVDVGSVVRARVTASNSCAVGCGSASAASNSSATVVASLPANTAPPAISGTAAQGQTLTADPGSWSGTPPLAYAYQWRRCDAAGGSCIDVAGASASTYALVAADVGSTLRVIVTASNAAGSASASSAASAVVAGPPSPPANTSLPTITGQTQEGQTLTATTGTWTGTQPVSYAYQWRRCGGSGSSCANIVLAVGSAYTLATADVGSTIRVVVTASNAVGSSTATSTQTAVIAAAPTATPPVNTSPPTVSGTARQGQTLSANVGAWSGTQPIAYAYQWERCDPADGSCADILDATGADYTLGVGDVGAQLRVDVTATNSAGSATAVSAKTAAVTSSATPPANSSLPTIGGTVRDGQTLTASTGSWTGTLPLAYAYEWRRCDAGGAGCVDIQDAIAQSYTIASADVGSTIRVVVTASNAAGSATASSAATTIVAAVTPSNVSPPTVSGTPQQNALLTAANGTWTGTTPISYAYQWRRCDSTGAGCVDIFAATAQAYGVGAADIGSTLRVAVTASNSAGSSTVASSQTAVVTPTATASTFGKTAVGSSSVWASGDYKVVSKFTLGEDGSVQKLTAYVFGTGTAGSQPIRGIVYADSSGSPGAFKGISQEATVAYNAGKAWVDLVFVTPVQLTAGDYWLGLHAGLPTSGDALTYFAYDTVLANGRTRYDPYADGPSDPFGTPTSKDRQMSVYATYAPTAPTPPTNTTAPTIGGQATVGATLSANAGTWSGTPPIGFTYVWRRCDTSGANCGDIAGASGQTYRLAAADAGATLRVVVTAVNTAGTTSATSTQTAVVGAAPPADPVLMAAGDIACGAASTSGGCAQMATSDLLVNGNPTAVLILGDNQYQCGQLADFQTFYGPSWGRLKTKTYPIPGNHEYESSADATDPCYRLPTGAPGYFGYFGAAATPLDPGCTFDCRGYYSVDLGSWHIVAVNSNCEQIGGCETGSAQETWLRSDLSQTTKPCVLAFWHHPRYASGGHATESTTLAMSAIWNDLYNARADLVLAGHDHDYERFAQLGPSDPTSYESTVDATNGLREIIVGTGGRSHGSFSSTIRTGSEVRNATAYGVLKLTLHPSSYDWQFVSVAGGTFTDSGTTACH